MLGNGLEAGERDGSSKPEARLRGNPYAAAGLTGFATALGQPPAHLIGRNPASGFAAGPRALDDREEIRVGAEVLRERLSRSALSTGTSIATTALQFSLTFRSQRRFMAGSPKR